MITLFTLIVRTILSTNKIGDPLDAFKLFYEEIISVKPSANRLRRVRQAKAGA
jgi:hypothetical protein